jgi:hypothetical protein
MVTMGSLFVPILVEPANYVEVMLIVAACEKRQMQRAIAKMAEYYQW